MMKTPDKESAPRSHADNSARDLGHDDGLRQENLRLKALVVQLSAIIAKNVATQ